jgi:Epoxide hydrolase N terminus
MKTSERDAIRPFRIEVPQEEIDELRRRVQATRWPEKETVADATQGVQLATTQELVRYWGAEYDFRRFESKLNALPPGWPSVLVNRRFRRAEVPDPCEAATLPPLEVSGPT